MTTDIEKAAKEWFEFVCKKTGKGNYDEFFIPKTADPVSAFLAGHAHAQRWISVEEKLPEEGFYVRIWSGLDYGPLEYHAQLRTESIDYYWDCGEFGFKKKDIGHWQPITGPAPKGEE